MEIARAIALRQHQRTMRLLAVFRAIWQMGTPGHGKSPSPLTLPVEILQNKDASLLALPVEILQNKDASLLTLPVEILQYIRDLLPLDSAACFIICNRSLLRILGSKTLHFLKEEDHVWERRRFLIMLEKELPDWQLCHPCSRFHPVDMNSRPQSLWGEDDEPKCVQLSGYANIDAFFKVRFQHVQLIMNRYRFGLPYVNDLKRLNYNYHESAPDSHVESTVTAIIEDSGLVMQVTSSLHLPNGWNKRLIFTRLPYVCRHNVACWLTRDPTLLETLQCCRSHGDGQLCAECRGWQRCEFCTTFFLVRVRESRDSGTNIAVEVRRCFGPCKDPFDPNWRQHIERIWL